jgi:ferritin-like metal-binding protein YciE
MAVDDTKELFVFLLSDLRRGAERTTKIFQEIGKLAEDPDIKRALEARVFASNKILTTLDGIFKLIGVTPAATSGGPHEVFVEDFRREFAEIQSPEARRHFILAKASHLLHFRIGEHAALISAADVSGHYGLGALLESSLANQEAGGGRQKAGLTGIRRQESAGRSQSQCAPA